jgi:NADH dehydrogenase
LRDAPVDIVLVGRCDHHLFQPLLYQVAAAALAPTEIAEPTRSILRNARCTRPIERFGDVVAHPILGGLHHRYARI